MREYRGKRRQGDPSQIAKRRGGMTSPGTRWEPGAQPSVDTPGQPAGPGAASSASGGAYNARMANFTFETKLESQQILPGNPNRVYLAIQNRGANAIYVSFGQKASAETFELAAGGFYEPYIAPDNSLNVLGVAAGDRIIVVEGTRG